MSLQRPKLRGTDSAFASRLLGTGVTRAGALESLVIAGYVRGLSTRDIEASLAEALGPEAAVSRSTVSRVCEQVAKEFATWRTRDLSGLDPLYVYLDASHFRYHEGARAESADACLGFLRDLGRVARPVVAGTDGLAVVGGYTAAPAYVDIVTPVVSSRSLSAASLANLFGAFLDPTPIPAPPSPRAPATTPGGK